MADHDAPEMPPSASGRGKQVFFLFMSAVVISVVVFLLGVSVGRGTRKTVATPDAGDSGDTTVAATPPIKTAGVSAAPIPTGDADRSTTASTPAPQSGSSSGPPPPTVSDAPAPVTAARSVTPPPAPDRPAPISHASGTYQVQVGAFKTSKAAQSLVAEVKAKDKSYPVSTMTLPESEPGPRFKVVVGPYSTLDEAKAAAARLTKDHFGAIIKH